MAEIWEWLKSRYVTISSPFRRTFVANKCGHRTKLVGWTRAFDEVYWLGMPRADNGKPDYCLECIGKMAIKCGWCGENIHIGSVITLYVHNKHTREDATIREEGNYKLVVGCQRMSCAETGGDYCGQWLPPGEVRRFPSVFERLASRVAAGEECPVEIAHF